MRIIKWEMYEVVLFALSGFFAGIVRAIVTGKGRILLPSREKFNEHEYLNLGFLAPAIIGALAGFIAPYSLGVDLVVSALAGYVGVDFIENVIERVLKLPK